MKLLKVATLKGKGTIEIPDQPLGRGGEGSVYEVTKTSLGFLKPSEIVAKIYHEPNIDKKALKIKTMIVNSPSDRSLAWPLGLLVDSNGSFVGYIMKKLDYSSYRPWATLAHSKERRNNAKDFSLKYALIACRNLAVSLHSIHSLGHCVGDVNESNMFISNKAEVFLIDLDSAQIKSKNGEVFPCVVGKPEYTAPELIGHQLRDIERTPQTDIFAFGIAVFQILTGGAHPTDSIYKGNDDAPSVSEKVSMGIYPSLTGQSVGNLHPVPRVATTAIPSVVKKVIESCLESGPTQRITLERVIEAFDQVISNLIQCDRNTLHFYDKRDRQCGACLHSDSGQIDPWSNDNHTSQKFNQVSLPGVDFDSNDDELIVKRAPAQIAGSSNNSSNFRNNFNPSGYGSPNVSQSNPSVNSTQSHTPQQNPQNQNGNPPQENKIPNKIKGKTVLINGQGEPIIRPPIMELMRSNPKLALHCIGNEIPKPMRPWWPNSRNIPNPIFVLISFIVGIVLSLSWIFLGKFLSNNYFFNYSGVIFKTGFLMASITSGLAVLSLFISSFIVLLKEKRRYRSLDNFERFPILKTLLTFLTVGIMAGPPLVLIIVFLILSGLISVLRIVVNESR